MPPDKTVSQQTLPSPEHASPPCIRGQASLRIERTSQPHASPDAGNPGPARFAIIGARLGRWHEYLLGLVWQRRYLIFEVGFNVG